MAGRRAEVRTGGAFTKLSRAERWTRRGGDAYKPPLRLDGASRPGSSVGRARD
jgi:hypothetical protein